MFVSVTLISAFMVHHTRACICTMQYDPVCCDNNQEYGNQCQANCDSATNCVPGVCLTDAPDAVGCDGICTSFYDGCNNCQCGDDGLAMCTKMACETQGTPECLGCADGYALNLDTKECEKPAPTPEPCICTLHIEPVCCDGNQQYGNQCQANCDSATNCVPGVCLTDAVGCDGICTSFYDGCNNCQCGDNGLAMCTQMACLTQGTPECLACADGYALNLITKECESSIPAKPSCGGIAFCQSFQEDYCNACGCPDPVGSPDVSYCTKMFCQLREENVCTACMDGYVLNNDGAECVKPAPTPEPCMCAQIYEPVCCNGQQYGNLCSAGCAGEMECEDGECAASPVSCGNGLGQCEDPFTCKKNPECRGSQLMCANDKVCQQVDGQCTSQDDCQAGFECMRRKANANRKFCIQFQ